MTKPVWQSIFGGLFWCAITFGFDGAILWQLFRQLQTWSFAEVSGTISSSSVDVTSSRRGHDYTPSVHFRYQVDGKDYEGQQHRRDFFHLGSDLAEEVVARYPVGREVTVYYDPAAPTEAVLEQRPDSNNLFLAMFMSPFNAIAIASIAVPIVDRRRRLLQRPILGVSLRENGVETMLRIYRFSPALAALIAWGTAGFGCTFLVFVLWLFWPMSTAIAIGWTIIALTIGVTLAYTFRRRADLRFEHHFGQLVISVPGQADLVIAAEDVLPVAYQRNKRKQYGARWFGPMQTSYRDGFFGEFVTHEISWDYRVELVYRDAEAQKQRRLLLVELIEESSAEEFAAWLNQHLAIKKRPRTSKS